MHKTRRINLKLWNQHPAKSGVDLHETLLCSPNNDSLQQPREIYHQCALSHYIQAEILCWCGGWPPMIPIQARVRNFEPPVRQKVALRTHSKDTVSSKYPSKPQKNAIIPQRGYIPSRWKPRYRQFGVDRYTYWENDIAVDKSRRFWRFWFYSSLCKNSMGCQHKLNNQHMHFHSLVHAVAGLNEKQHLSVQLQQLLYLIWIGRWSQSQKTYCKFTWHQWNDPLTDIQTAEEAYRPTM